MQHYSIHQAAPTISWTLGFDSPFWQTAEVAHINHFHPESSNHHPKTRAKLLYDASALYVAFHVKDKYILARGTAYQDEVYKDSCVELFVQPSPEHGYFNFEMNCIGTLLLTYIEDPERLPEGGFKQYTQVPESLGSTVEIQTTLQETILSEKAEPQTWELTARIPFSLFGEYIPGITHEEWRGNIYKCADESSRPHWGSWSPIGEELNFHAPQYFGAFDFVEIPSSHADESNA